MEEAPGSPNIKTRFLIVSDIHGTDFMPGSKPAQRADVAIHCGDLTQESKVAEYRSAIQLLNDINAPLKLVIAGNHDFTMDIPEFQQKLNEARPPLDLDLARDSGITYLDEGVHHFILDNAVSLTVYSSPYTPSLGDWGFQYHPEQGRDFSLGDADVVITHGPPRGIMDYTNSGQLAGGSSLFRAVARARPRMHCFGHIHEAWGAKLVAWRSTVSGHPSHFTDIGHGKSVLVENLAGLDAKTQGGSARETCCVTSHCAGDTNPLEKGAQTLFVNAAILDSGYCPVQLPWLVDIELPRAR